MHGQTATWAYTPSLDTTNGNGIVFRTVTHSSNTIIDRADLPYIWVGYTAGPLRDDFPLTGSAWGKTAHGGEKHTFSGGEYYHAIFYVGCQIWTSTTNGCYKYEQQYYIYDSGFSSQPELDMYLKSWGPGYYATMGNPTYYDVYWRVDTDVKGSTNDKYEQYNGAWSQVGTETGFTSIGSTDNGREWRTYDTGAGNGNSKRIEIWPVLADFSKIWLLRFQGTKISPSQNDGNPDGYLNSESLLSQDDLYWMRTHRVGSQCVPSSPCLMAHVVTLTGL